MAVTVLYWGGAGTYQPYGLTVPAHECGACAAAGGSVKLALTAHRKSGKWVTSDRVVGKGGTERAFMAGGAMARKLAIQLYWMMRKGWDYEQVKRFGPHAGQPENRRGVQ